MAKRNPHLFYSLALACKARNKEFKTPPDIAGSFWGIEISGEAGESVIAMLEMLRLQARIGRANNLTKKLERERMGMAGSRATKQQLADELADIQISLQHNANHWGIDLHKATYKKFNKTSESLGMKTKLLKQWRETAPPKRR